MPGALQRGLPQRSHLPQGRFEHRASGTLDTAIDVALGLLHRFGWTSVTGDMVAAMQTSYRSGLSSSMTEAPATLWRLLDVVPLCR